jgi:hypothetical protein
VAASATSATSARPAALEGTSATESAPRRESRLPAIACAAAVLLAGVIMAWVGTRVSTFEFDEAHYRASAVHYRDNLPHNFLHDLSAYATSRLYALTLAPLFAVADGDVAVRVAKVYNAVLWCSTAIPLWLLTRGLLTPWRRAAAVTLGVVAPWMLLTTLLFTESMALPAFVWFTFAALQAVRRPAWWRDGLVMVAFVICILARVQLAGAIAGYVLLIAVGAREHLTTIRGTPWWWAGRELLRYLRRYAFTCAAIAAIALYFVYLKLNGTFEHQFTQIFGVYASTKNRPTLFGDGFAMVLVEVLAISAGLGITSVLLGVPWYARTLASKVRDDAWWYAAATLCVGAGLIAFTAYSQGSYWGDITEERYWMYTFPFLWPAAFAAAQRRTVRTSDILLVSAVLVAIAGALGVPRHLDQASVVLAPVMATLGSLTDQALKPLTATSRDQVALLVLVVCAVAWFVVRRMPWVRLEWLLAGGALLQLVLLAVPVLALEGKVVDNVNRTGADFAALGWIDRAASGDVAWLPSEPRRNQDALAAWQRSAMFWTSKVTTRVGVNGSTPAPDPVPLEALDRPLLEADPRTGRLQGALPTAEVVAWPDSPYEQLAGRVLAHAPDSALALIKPAAPARLQYRSVGLAADDGLPIGSDVKLDVWPAAGRAAKVTLTFDSLGVGTVRLKGAGRTQRLELPATGQQTATVTVCGRHGKLTLRGVKGATPAATEAAALSAVAVQRAPAGACAS